MYERIYTALVDGDEASITVLVTPDDAYGSPDHPINLAEVVDILETADEGEVRDIRFRGAMPC